MSKILTGKLRYATLFCNNMKEKPNRGGSPSSQDLYDLITSHTCVEAEKFYEDTIKGRVNLVWKPAFGHSNINVLLPTDVSSESYEMGRRRIVKPWVEEKKKTVDQLIVRDIDKAGDLLIYPLGHIVNLHVRKGLIDKRPEYRSFIEQEAKGLAREMGLSGNFFSRKLREIELKKQVGDQKDDLKPSTKYEYYLELKALLGK